MVWITKHLSVTFVLSLVPSSSCRPRAEKEGEGEDRYKRHEVVNPAKKKHIMEESTKVKVIIKLKKR